MTLPIDGQPSLTCFRLFDGAPEIEPARLDRWWMDQTGKRFAYRCTPLNIANTSGWSVLCPCAVEAEWDGGRGTNAIRVKLIDEDGINRSFVCSHFGHGVLTFHIGYLFRTSKGWAAWLRGPPNAYKDGLTPLEGIVETEWLPFSSTMNWRFTRPGIVRFRKGEPFCFITLTPHAILDSVAINLSSIGEEKEMLDSHQRWLKERNAFNAQLRDLDSEASKMGWQKKYLRGVDCPAGTFHTTKRHMPKPCLDSDADGLEEGGGSPV